jgi:TPR repeat protein
MPRIIFKCRYLKNASEHLNNFVEYVATREGVEKVPDTRGLLSATKKQQELIADILQKIPDTADLFEYEDYLKNQTRENASEFITVALEQNIDLLGKRENYVGYIANRPGAEALGAHGLFTDANVPVVLSQVAKEVGSHSGNVWTNVVSLRREDAARLGYDNAKAWQNLICGQRNHIAQQMKIKPENLRWYAAFHNEGHHPHVHIIAYSVNPSEAYVTKEAINNMRGGFAKEIFKQDLLQIYSEQTKRRDILTGQSRDVMAEIIRQISTGICENKTIEELMTHLAERLKHTSGKKQYGYLKAPLKAVIDQIVDELAKDERVAQCYEKWYEMRNEVLRTYADKLPPPLPLSQQKEFKSIKNMVITEAMNIGGHHFTFEPDEATEASAEEMAESSEVLPAEEALTPVEEPEADTEADAHHSGPEPLWEEAPEAEETAEFHPHVEWSDRYKEARAFLYGTDEIEPDFAEAYYLFIEEAETGNALAMHDLGRMHMDGLGMEMDAALAQEWYAKALDTFMVVEAEKPKPYLQYRIGKMHAAGLGTPQDYEAAAEWFKMAVAKNHKYAQYSLAGLYYQGRGVEQDFETAFDLYWKSARQANPYASYELAKMLRDGIGTEKDLDEAEDHFKRAFAGFVKLEAVSRDDKLQYRLGHMLYHGVGTEKDVAAAIVYFEKAARLGNVHAQYMLGKIYLDTGSGHENAEKALAWLSKAAGNGSSLAQYALGKLYRDGEHVEKDILKAVELFTQSAEQENQYAAYALGKLYLNGEDIPKDTGAAVKWLTFSSGLGNQYAQYALAKLYLAGEDVPKDVPKAIDLLIKSANQENQFAQYRLGKLYLLGEDVPKDIGAAVKWLTASAEQGNQYAQYALGKLYILGHDVPRDRDAAVKWLTASAAQGNIYAQFFLDHMDSFRDPSVLMAATRLMHYLSNIFRDEKRRSGGGVMQSDRKLLQKLRQKKIAQGHARDDHAPKQTY